MNIFLTCVYAYELVIKYVDMKRQRRINREVREVTRVVDRQLTWHDISKILDGWMETYGNMTPD